MKKFWVVWVVVWTAWGALPLRGDNGSLFLLGRHPDRTVYPSDVISGPTYFVATTGGDDTRTCLQATTLGTPKRTINNALGCLTPGDTLLVRGGTYVESLINVIPSGTSWSATVRIAAYPGETVWMAPTSGNWVIYFDGTPSYIEFDGININGAGIGDASVFFDDRTGGAPHHIRFQNAEVHHREGAGNTNAAILIAGHDNEFLNLTVHGTGGPYGFYIHGTANLVQGCNIYATSLAGIQLYHNASAPGYLAPPTANIVRGNRIHDITQSYFFGAVDTRLWGILDAGVNDVLVNNVIYGLSLAYVPTNAGIYAYYSSGTKVWNNTIYSNTTDGIVINAGSTGAEVRNNIGYANAGSQYTNEGTGTTATNNLLGVNPLFVNPAAGNFQIALGSPALNTGVTLVAVPTDILGVTRPQRGAYDIGAYELP